MTTETDTRVLGRAMSSADICRRLGWGVGTRLTTSSPGVCGLEISSVGLQLVLGRKYAGTEEKIIELRAHPWVADEDDDEYPSNNDSLNADATIRALTVEVEALRAEVGRLMTDLNDALTKRDEAWRRDRRATVTISDLRLVKVAMKGHIDNLEGRLRTADAAGLVVRLREVNAALKTKLRERDLECERVAAERDLAERQVARVRDLAEGWGRVVSKESIAYANARTAILMRLEDLSPDDACAIKPDGKVQWRVKWGDGGTFRMDDEQAAREYKAAHTDDDSKVQARVVSPWQTVPEAKR